MKAQISFAMLVAALVSLLFIAFVYMFFNRVGAEAAGASAIIANLSAAISGLGAPQW
ncbi:MAG: hypothetical protein QXR73_03760 [Candidatus Micrarchaeaceae archaeon]